MRFACEPVRHNDTWVVSTIDAQGRQIIVGEWAEEKPARDVQKMLNEADTDERDRLIRLIALMQFSAYNC